MNAPASALRGLSEAEAAARLRVEGPNDLPAQNRQTALRILVEVLREPMFALLLGGALVYLALGDLKEAVVLLAFAATSVSIALVQEARTERVLESLRDLTSPRALVIRDGVERRIPGCEVVRGDIVVLAEGDRVPADAILRAAHDLQLDESLLTGESVPVRKLAATAANEPARPGGDDQPYVYSGSLVVRGHGHARVTAIGARSEIGKIGLAIGRIETEPPRLRAQVRRLVARFAAVSLTVSVLATVLYGLWRGSWLEALLSGIALGMSMLPEEFPLVLTVFMVMGAWRISRARVLTRRIAAIETLGAATVLCTDKTGTLTQNRMSIATLWTAGGEWQAREDSTLPDRFGRLLEHGILATAAAPLDPMDKAFHALGAEQLPRDAHVGRVLKWEYGLRPDLLAVTQIWEQFGSHRLIAAAKGAPEAIAELCRLSTVERGAVEAALNEMSGSGMRVLGVAAGSLASGAERPQSPRDIEFQFLGLVGLADPLRPSVPDAVRECRGAGIRVVMITGDYPQTARAIAAEAGIDAGSVMTGGDLEHIDDAELRRPPRDPDAPLLTAAFAMWSLLQGVLVLALVAGLFIAAVHRGLPEVDARALAFAALVAANVGLVLVDRAGGASLFAAFRRPNPALWWVLGLTGGILTAILLIVPARALFAFGPLHIDDVAVALAAGVAALILLDMLKRAIGPGRRGSVG